MNDRPEDDYEADAKQVDDAMRGSGERAAWWLQGFAAALILAVIAYVLL